jgi:hypothetical protein
VKQHLDVSGLARDRGKITDIGEQEVGGVARAVALLEERKLALVVVDSGQRFDFELFQELARQLLADRAAYAGDHDALAAQIGPCVVLRRRLGIHVVNDRRSARLL